MQSRADQSIGHMQGVGEAGAGRVEVDRPGAFHAEMLLDPAGYRRKRIIGRRCGGDDEIDIVQGCAVSFPQPFGGANAQM